VVSSSTSSKDSVPKVSKLTLAVGLLALAGCGSSSNSTSSSASAPASAPAAPATSSSSAATPAPTARSEAGGATLKLAADPGGQLKFDASSLTAKAGKVTIDFASVPRLEGPPHLIELVGRDAHPVL
jgi:hypothetical protein